jgi:hypothetical protein
MAFKGKHLVRSKIEIDGSILEKVRSEVIRKALEISGIQDVRAKYTRTGSIILKEWTTPDFRNTPSTTNLEEEEIVDAPGNDCNASMPLTGQAI